MGDYIVDSFTVEAGNISFPKGAYNVHVGFFQGSHGSWKNMNIVSAQNDKGKLSIGSDKRVHIARLSVY